MSSIPSSYGATIAFIEERFEKYKSEPNSVSTRWREFFRDFQPEEEAVSVAAGASPAAEPARAPAPTPPPRPVPVPAAAPNATPLRGAAGKLAQNMEASLAVPTATSVRTIPVKALEENRQVINNHLTLNGQTKASFTH